MRLSERSLGPHAFSIGAYAQSLWLRVAASAFTSPVPVNLLMEIFVHRDLKPENHLSCARRHRRVPNVVDFGLAKFLSTSREETIDTDRGQAIGTMRFMPPEQLRGHEVDPACDLWALTVMVYEMLTGTDPFAGATAAECYRAILTESFTPVSKHLPTRPDELCWGAFCDRMWFLDVTALVRDPEHRAHRARSTFLYRA